jgi:hypothetical protein
VAAKKKTTAKDKRRRSARRAAIRELSDPRRWWRLTKVRAELLPHLGKYTANDLMKELKSGRLRCVRRIETDAKYAEEVPVKFWRSLQWPGKVYFARIGAYNPEFYVWRPWEVWPKLQAANGTEASKPERKRATGGGSKPKYTDKQKEFGREIYRAVREDPEWRSASQEAVAKRVQELAERAGHPLGGSLKTVQRNIMAPVDAELE